MLLGDILPHLTALSLVFQRADVDLSAVEPEKSKTCKALELKKTTCGLWGKKLQKYSFPMRRMNCNEEEFDKSIKLPLINSLINHIQIRFQNAELLSKLAVLALPVQDEHLMDALPALYRQEDVSEYFNLDPEKVTEEWVGWLEWLKNTDIPQSPRWPSTLPFLVGILLDRTSDKSSSLRDMYPTLAHLYSIMATLSLSSAEVERLFSHLKLVKTDRRASLSNKRLNQLLNIKLNLHNIGWSDVRRAATSKWFSRKSRRLTFMCKTVKGT